MKMNQNSNKVCRQHLEKLIAQLMQPRFGVPAHAAERFQNLYDRVEVVHINSSGKEIRLRLPYDGWVRTLGISQVIDVPPRCWKGMWCEGHVVLVLADANQRLTEWTITHELCHLLSIGPYKKKRRGWWHSYGINEFWYQPKNGQMICQAQRQDAINELMTDLAVLVLQQNRKAEQKAPYRGLELFADYVRKCVPGQYPLERLVGKYVSGQTEQIRQWILDGRWKSYHELNMALRTKKNRI